MAAKPAQAGIKVEMLIRTNMNSRQYQLTSCDVNWLARSMWGECGPKAKDKAYNAVAYCMLQRFMRWPVWGKWDSFAQFVRAFSQPVNPKWSDPDGEFAAKWPKLFSEAHLKRRDIIQTRPWGLVPEPPKKAAVLFAVGLADNPVPDAINFASRALIKRQGRTGITIGGNTFIDDTQDKMRWRPGKVEIVSVF